MEKIIHSLFKITQDVTGFLLKTEFFFLGFNFLKANSHHKNIKKRKVLVACKKSFKHEASKSLFAIGGGEQGRGGNLFFEPKNKVNYGTAQMANRDLFLRDRWFVWFDIYLFQYFKNLNLVEKIVFQILKKRYPKPFWKVDKAYDCQ